MEGLEIECDCGNCLSETYDIKTAKRYINRHRGVDN